MDDGMLRRAGFWRRTLAGMVDFFCVSVPCSLLAGLLFSASAGHIQASTGLTVTVCEDQTSYPDHLDPAPPADSNFAKHCRVLSLAGETARVMTVGREEKTATSQTEVSRGYMLDANNNVIAGNDWNWVIWVLLLAPISSSRRAGGAAPLGCVWFEPAWCGR